MEIHGMFANGVNVIALAKEGKFYAMTCAWATQIDYDRFVMCIGGQSDTGKALKIGDIVGVSPLSDKQEQIGIAIGSFHSSDTDKKKLADFELLDGAYVVKGAKNQLAGKVLYIEHFPQAPNDSIVQIQVLNAKEDKNASFLTFKEE